jgi:hypothetical protein
VPVAWDARGCPVGLALATEKETEYLVDTEDITGRELFKFLRQKVKVTGLLGRILQNRRMITVSGFSVIKIDGLKQLNSTGVC